MKVLPTKPLTTAAALREEIGSGCSESGDYMARLILEGSSIVESELDRSLGRVSYQYTVLYDQNKPLAQSVALPLYPTAAVTEVAYKNAGVTEVVDADEYEVDALSGYLFISDPVLCRMQPKRTSADPFMLLLVTHEGGYHLPDDPDNRDLPHDIERAVLNICRAEYTQRGRDPQLRSETVPNVSAVQYFSGRSMNESVSMYLESISGYRDMRFPA